MLTDDTNELMLNDTTETARLNEYCTTEVV